MRREGPGCGPVLDMRARRALPAAGRATGGRSPAPAASAVCLEGLSSCWQYLSSRAQWREDASRAERWADEGHDAVEDANVLFPAVHLPTSQRDRLVATL